MRNTSSNLEEIGNDRVRTLSVFLVQNMYKKVHLLLFMSCFLLGEFVPSFSLWSDCYPDNDQDCDKDSVNLEWPESKTRFLLFTRKNKKDPELLHLCNGTLPRNSHFNPKNKLVVIIPGFMFGTCELEVIPQIKDEMLDKEDLNVIILVSSPEFGNDFLTAMVKTEKVANITTKVLQNIQAKTGFKKDMYLIGHSLGAHVAGLVGQQIPIHRITGLDPAGVTYVKDTPKEKRLDPSDADIVDVIHTNGGTGLPYFGAYFPMGDADIYVNGGSIQPSCSNSIWEEAKSLNFLVSLGMFSIPSICAHMQSLDFYKLSIHDFPDKFIAHPCSSYKKFEAGNCTGDGSTSVLMGYDFEKSFKPNQKSKKFPRKYYIDTKDLFSTFFSWK